MDTIFAPATAIVKSGVSVIRISGNQAFSVIEKLTKSKLSEPRKAVLRKLYSDELIDEALVICFKAPHSFTGEDVVEIHCHGSIAVISELMQHIAKLGPRIAEAGEFSKRAFMNNKMDLSQAEGLADLIDAETKIQAKMALRHVDGQISKLYDNWREKIINILSLFEAYLDFPEEEIPENVIEDANNQINEIKSSINKFLNDSNSGQRIRNGLVVSITGKPNVGKSSLLNNLLKRDIAIVSDIAGTTRDIIEAHLDIGGYPIILADTAGIRKSTDKIEDIGIKKALEYNQKADLVIEISDIDDIGASNNKENTIKVVNKIDRSPNLDFGDYLPISIKENIGIDLLINKIEEFAKNNFSCENLILTHQRHRDHLQKSLDSLEKLDLELPIELIAEDLRISAKEIGQITGKIDIEEILDNIFSNFCIGK